MRPLTKTVACGNDVPVGFELMLEELYQLDFPRPDGAKATSPSRGGTASSNVGLGDMGAVGAGASGFGLGDSPFGNVGLGTALNSMGSMGFGGVGGMSVGDLGAYGAMGKGGLGGIDFSELSKLGDSAAGAEMADLMKEMQSNPQAMQQRMRDEYAHMSPDEQSKMLDALASMGFASRAWWERFLRGF